MDLFGAKEGETCSLKIKFILIDLIPPIFKYNNYFYNYYFATTCLLENDGQYETSSTPFYGFKITIKS